MENSPFSYKHQTDSSWVPPVDEPGKHINQEMNRGMEIMCTEKEDFKPKESFEARTVADYRWFL